MLFNLESDSLYESEMIKVKSRGITYDETYMFVAKNSKRIFIYTAALSKTCQLLILYCAQRI